MVDSGTMWRKVVIIMLMGEYHHNIDDKQRIIIPSKFREELGQKVIVTRGLENCLFLYSQEEWKNITSKLKSLPFTKKDARSFMRIFMSGATVCEFDRQGRITIPSPLTTYAEIKKECVVIGVGERLEVWSIEKWNEFFDENKKDLSDLADHLFETNFED